MSNLSVVRQWWLVTVGCVSYENLIGTKGESPGRSNGCFGRSRSAGEQMARQ